MKNSSGLFTKYKHSTICLISSKIILSKVYMTKKNYKVFKSNIALTVTGLYLYIHELSFSDF